MEKILTLFVLLSAIALPLLVIRFFKVGRKSSEKLDKAQFGEVSSQGEKLAESQNVFESQERLNRLNRFGS